MKKITFIFLLLGIAFQSYVKAQNNVPNAGSDTQKGWKPSGLVDDKILSFYRQYGVYTNPGEFEPMYANLPDSLAVLCKLIKAQMIHPVADLPRYRNLIPPERSYEDLKYPTVQSILAGLKRYNPEGLVLTRKPEDRLIVSCRYHAILFASILKHKGVPARVRYGFASYLYPGHHIYHVICEVWNKNEKRWMLVDPDRQLIDISSQQFQLACDAWTDYQQGKLDPATYGVPNWWGGHPILDVLCHDLASVLGNEHTYYNRPPISADTTMNVKDLPKAKIELMNKVSALLTNVDANFNQLRSVYSKNAELRFLNTTTEISDKTGKHKTPSSKR